MAMQAALGFGEELRGDLIAGRFRRPAVIGDETGEEGSSLRTQSVGYGKRQPGRSPGKQIAT